MCFCTILMLVTPLRVAAQPGSRAYAGRGYGVGIDIIDVDSMTKIGTIPDAGGYRMVLSLDGKKLYSTAGNAFIYITDTEVDTLIKAFDPSVFSVTSSELEGIAISPDGSKVYVIDESTTAVFVIDTNDDSIIQAGTLAADEPENVVVSPDGQFLYVNDNTWTTKFSTITFEDLGFLTTAGDGHGVAVSQDGAKVYAEGVGVIVIDTATMTATDTLSAGGYYITVSQDGSRVYAVNESNKLAVIDTQADTIMTTVTLSSFGCSGVTANQSGQTVLVAGNAKLIKLDASALTETGTLAGSYQSVVILELTGPVPVELASFSATMEVNRVVLEWHTESENNNFGFDVQRMEGSVWETIGFVEGHGTTTQPQTYMYVDPLSDALADASAALRYRLKQIDTDGSYVYSEPVDVLLSLPESALLLQNYPNPFNPTTTITYAIPEQGKVSLVVYDLLGRTIQTIVNDVQDAGTYSISFDATGLPSGLYFYRLYLDSRLVAARKMALVR